MKTDDADGKLGPTDQRGLSVINTIRMMRRDGEDGVTAIEYALIAALIALVIIAAVTLVGGSLNDLFSEVGTELENA